ncbi:tetratricopeptide repeat protein [Streptomyces sp. NPDC056188]|uniref:tetratricopeptide repeat protein n=1 Tax=Streptomyces sp. NPDC056188 TaxID=3345740 RepID=UPI0035D9933E
MAKAWRRAGTVVLGAALPAVVGGAVLAATGVHAWAPYLSVTAVSALSALVAMVRHRQRRAGPATDPVRRAKELPETEGAPERDPGSVRAVYDMTRPIRPVPVQGLPDDTPFVVRAAVHSQLMHIASPGLLGNSEAVNIPLTGHNLLVSLTATGEDEIVLRSLRAEVTDRLPLLADGSSLARSRMPDIAMSSDLLESAQRAVRAYRRLLSPDVAIFLDRSPVTELAELGADPVLPLTVAPGGSATLTCAPVTQDGRWVRWRLTAEIDCAGHIWRPWWELTVTASTGFSLFSPHAAPVPQPVHKLYPDHYDPGDPDRQRAAESTAERFFDLTGHTSQDGEGWMSMPSRPDPDREPPDAAEAIRRAAGLARAGDLQGAAEAYRAAAEAGSGQAAYLLGRLSQDRGDHDGAVLWYEKAAARRVPAAYNNLGMLALLRGDIDTAEHWYRRAMDVGDWAAAVGLGVLMSQRGDEAQAEALWRLAGKQGAPNADHNLAVLYERQGRLLEAEELFTRAAEAGDIQAAVHVGFRCHETGDQTGAKRWWRKAADAGSADGTFYLGLLLMGEGQAEEGEQLLERAAERLGTPGQGVTRTSGPDAASTHRTEATAASGEVHAAYHLGLLHWGRHDVEAAVVWLTRAAGAGHPDAVFRLCDLYLNVRGDLAECLRWASFALELEGVTVGQLKSLAAWMCAIEEQLVETAGAYEPDPAAAAGACFVAAGAYRRLTTHDDAYRAAWEGSVQRLADLAERSGSWQAQVMAASAEADFQ